MGCLSSRLTHGLEGSGNGVGTTDNLAALLNFILIVGGLILENGLKFGHVLEGEAGEVGLGLPGFELMALTFKFHAFGGEGSVEFRDFEILTFDFVVVAPGEPV